MPSFNSYGRNGEKAINDKQTNIQAEVQNIYIPNNMKKNIKNLTP